MQNVFPNGVGMLLSTHLNVYKNSIPYKQSSLFVYILTGSGMMQLEFLYIIRYLMAEFLFVMLIIST